MSPQDFVYKQAMHRALSQGMNVGHASSVAAQAVRFWRRDNKAAEAIDKAIKQAPKSLTKKKLK